MPELLVRRGLVLALVMALASPALAQSDSERAQRLFDDGLKQLDQGNFAEACHDFEGSQKFEPKLTTLLNLADCREKNHQLATAWSLFNEARQAATQAGETRLALVATNHATKLEPRLSHLTIAVPPDRQVSGLTILRGKDPVPAASWNRAVPVDGGVYTIQAQAPGREPWSTTRRVKDEGDAQTVDVPKLADAGPITPPTTPNTTGGGAGPGGSSGPGGGGHGDTLSTEGTVSQRPSLAVPLSLGGGALVLGGIGLGLELSSERIYDQAKADRAKGQGASADAERDSANTRRHVAQALGVAAVGCAGAAVYFYLRGGSDSRSTTAVAPIVSPDLAGLAVAGRW